MPPLCGWFGWRAAVLLGFGISACAIDATPESQKVDGDLVQSAQRLGSDSPQTCINYENPALCGWMCARECSWTRCFPSGLCQQLTSIGCYPCVAAPEEEPEQPDVQTP